MTNFPIIAMISSEVKQYVPTDQIPVKKLWGKEQFSENSFDF